MIRGWCILGFCMLFSLSLLAQGKDLKFVRTNYALAVENKALCLSMIRELKVGSKDPIRQAYLGAYQTVWAKHVVNPMQKLRYFKQGTKLIEAQVKKNPDLLELRFIRLSIQKNAPAFLGYHSEIAADTKLLKQKLDLVSSPELKRNIEELLK